MQKHGTLSVVKSWVRNHPFAILLIGTTFLAVLYFSLGLNSWKFAFVGDEWAFFRIATSIVDRHFQINPFSLQGGAYGENWTLSSMYQALFLAIFGQTNIAWRLSNILLILPISFFFYFFVKNMINRETAFISTILLQSSFYLANFFKIGKNMPQALALFIIVLYVARICHNPTPRPKFFILLGVLLGLSFYIYIGPVFPVLILPILLPILFKHYKEKRWLYCFALLGISYVFSILPALYDLTFFAIPLKKTILFREYSDMSQIGTNILHNFLLFYHNYDYSFNQYVAGPYLDIITRISATIGIIICVIRIKSEQYRTILISYLLLGSAFGLISPYAYAPTTRGIFFLPFGCLFAGIGITTMLTFLGKSWKLWLLPIILFCVVSLNVYTSQVGVFQKTGYSRTAFILKAIQQANEKHVPYVFLIINSNNSVDMNNIRLIQQAYQLSKVKMYTMTYQDLPNLHPYQAILLYDVRDTNVTNIKRKISSMPPQYVMPFFASWY